MTARAASRSRRAVVVAGLAVVLASTAACSGDTTSDQTEAAAKIVTTTTTTAPPATTSSTAPPVAANFDDLSRMLLTGVPAGYKVQPNDVGDTGPSDLEKAIRDDGGDDARAVLTANGFVRGYQRYWSKSDEDEIVAFLYQFKDNAGAAEYGKRTKADLADLQDGVAVSPFDLPGIEGATGLTAHSDGFSTSMALFSKGPYLVQLVVTGTTPAGQAEMVKGLAADQFARL
jgi:hypothetical protein